MAETTFTVVLHDDDDNEVEHELPAKLEVCPRCEGHGTHLTPSIGQHAYCADEWAEQDDEFREEYCRRGGIYDVQCEKCHGRNVVPVVDGSRLSAEQRQIYDQWLERETERAREDDNDRRTRHYESGGYDS